MLTTAVAFVKKSPMKMLLLLVLLLAILRWLQHGAAEGAVLMMTHTPPSTRPKRRLRNHHAHTHSLPLLFLYLSSSSHFTHTVQQHLYLFDTFCFSCGRRTCQRTRIWFTFYKYKFFWDVFICMNRIKRWPIETCKEDAMTSDSGN